VEKDVITETMSKKKKIPPGKVMCQECRKIINEGLTFCPECGERIPEFFRFNPDSSSGLY